MRDLETLRNAVPDHARDTKLNLQAVFEGGVLHPAQKHGVAVAVARGVLVARGVEVGVGVDVGVAVGVAVAVGVDRAAEP